MTTNTLVLASIAIADKIDILKQRKEFCIKWKKEGDQSEKNQNFWQAQIDSFEKDIQDHIQAKQEIMES
jgi:hypothetical protein